MGNGHPDDEGKEKSILKTFPKKKDSGDKNGRTSVKEYCSTLIFKRKISQREPHLYIKEKEMKAAITVVAQFTSQRQGVEEMKSEKEDPKACRKCKIVECECYSQAEGY